LEYVKDTTPPTAKVKEATQNKVVIEFNELLQEMVTLVMKQLLQELLLSHIFFLEAN